MFSDLTGRFPATAMEGSQYILLSVYKCYIHLELLASRVESAIIDAYSRTYQCFFSSDTSNSSKSWTTKHLKDYDNTS
jgi:hypothetical protein